MEGRMIILELPWPTSINRYWTMAHGRIVVSGDGKKFRSRVRETINAMRQAGRLAVEPIGGRLGVLVELHEPPLKRYRDVDNALKCLVDSLQHADLYANDRTIDDLRVVRRGPLEGGSVTVKVWQLPEETTSEIIGYRKTLPPMSRKMAH